ncbi:S1 family peptidase [Saccharothrix sp. Mg75]|uniref:S1 family peptidase n=1 Tax=Saccharothrix sp. Mg75 TaxID=3445357 RepID=UPI003EEFFDCA
MRTLLIALVLLLGTAAPAAAVPVLAAPVPAAPVSAAPVPLEAGTPLTTAAGARCTNGFNVRGHLLVQPSCGPVGTVVRGPGGGVVGSITAVRPTYAVVTITDAAAWVQRPTVAGRPGVVTGSVETPVGGSVCRVGGATGLRCGTVQARNVTVFLPAGTITGVTRTNLCPEPGDHWAPVISGSNAQGHVIGGSGGCSSGGTTFFYPVNRVLAAEGFTLVTG